MKWMIWGRSTSMVPSGWLSNPIRPDRTCCARVRLAQWAGVGLVPGAIAFECFVIGPMLSYPAEAAPLPAQVATAETQFLPSGPGVFLPDFPTFNSQLLDQQIYLYGNYVLSNGPPDVLIIGSSRSLQGVDPEVLQMALAARGMEHLTVYNFGVNGATAQVVDLVLRQLLAPEQLPRLVLWADGSRAFNSGRADITYNGITASPGYQRLRAGDRPIPVLTPLAVYADTEEICIEITPWVSDLSDLPRPCTTLPSSRSPDAALSRPLTATLRSPTILNLTPLGFSPVLDEYNPSTYYRHFPRVAGRYDSNYAPFRLTGVQTTATLAVARYLRDRQIPLVFINLPLDRDYIDRYRQTREQQFHQQMQRLASQGGFTFRDLGQQWNTQHHYFADPSHLNQHGARAVAQYLATDSAIPWATLTGLEGEVP